MFSIFYAVADLRIREDRVRHIIDRKASRELESLHI